MQKLRSQRPKTVSRRHKSGTQSWEVSDFSAALLQSVQDSNIGNLPGIESCTLMAGSMKLALLWNVTAV